MGFFKDFKRDFAQAVNELMPDKDELADEYDDEDMVNTFDENDNMDVAPEDMLENLDDFNIENMQDTGEYETGINQQETPDSEYDNEEETEKKDALADIPQAEIIGDAEPADSLQDMEKEVPETGLITELVAEHVIRTDENGETISDAESEMEPESEPVTEPDPAEKADELSALDALDEDNMLEGMEDAVAVESDTPYTENVLEDELKNVDLNQDVRDALMMRETSSDSQDDDSSDDMEDSSMAEVEAKIENQEQDINSILNDDTTYITKGTVIKGNVETDGCIDIIGTVEGDVNCGGKLIVGGTIKGSVIAGEIYANAAKIEGDVVTEGSVKIGVGSVVVGNVSATSAVVAGAVNGDIDVKGPVIVDSTAVIMGNIKSRSVQINNGAVIEGFCSQCYSEIDVKSFFE